MSKKLSLMTARTLPKFVNEEYPQFVKFLKHYFEFLEREGGEFHAIDTLLETADIDQTLDDYLHYYKSEYLVGFPESMAVDIRFLVKKIKDFYSAKGTEKSFEFLFRTVFDAPVEFYYPKVDMLRVSDGAWIQPYYVIPERLNVTETNPDLFELIDQKIQGQTSGASAYIDARTLLTVSFPELVDDSKFVLGVDTWAPYGDATLTHNPETETATLLRNGSNESGMTGNVYVSDSALVELVFDISNFVNNLPAAQISVKIDDVLIGYISDTGLTKFEAVSVTPFTTINIKLEMLFDESWSTIFNSVSLKNNATTLMVYGSSLSEVEGEFIGGETIKVISPRFDTSGNALPEIPDFKLMDTIRGQSAIFQPKGRYADTGGHLSSTKKIQDSYYYQDFSYELISEIPLKYYTDIVKDLVHPAGFQMFGKVETKSVDVISLQDLIAFFEILIAWETLSDRSVEVVQDAENFTTIHDVDTTHSERQDWEYFYKNKEGYQYDALQIGDFDNYSAADFDDLRSGNMSMVFVDGKKIPSNEYYILDKQVYFDVAPPKSLYNAHDSLSVNIEILHLSHTLQSPTIFDTDGFNIRFRLNDDLEIDEHYEVLVFADGVNLDYIFDYSIEQYSAGGVTVSDIVFSKIHNAGVTMDVVVLDGSMIKGTRYKPDVMYRDLPNGSIANNKPFPIINMMDTDNTEELMLFTNGLKVNSKTAYSIYYDIEDTQYMIRPLIVPSEIGINAPYKISAIYLQGSIVDVDSITADGVTTVYDISSNFNYMKHGTTTIVDEYQALDLVSDGEQTTYTFNRNSSSDFENVQVLPINIDNVSNGDKVKLYFNIEITDISTYFDFPYIGLSDASIGGLSTFTDRYMSFENIGKYTYNREFIVTDESAGLGIGIGNLKGSISNITLSLIDNE